MSALGQRMAYMQHSVNDLYGQWCDRAAPGRQRAAASLDVTIRDPSLRLGLPTERNLMACWHLVCSAW